MAVKQFDVMSLGRAGLFDPGEMGYRDSLDIIKEESVKIQKSFVKIGWYLKHIQDNELYREDGYENISECAAEQFGYSQSTVSRFIAICEKFSKDHNSPELDERYSGFDKSQMMEMLPMSPEQLESVTPDMTVRQIRDIKDSRRGKQKDENDAKETKEAEEEKLPGQTSIEEDFPEYMPDIIDSEASEIQEDDYATSHKEEVEEEPEGDKSEVYSAVGTENVQALPALKNNDQRKQWLKNYKTWGLWYRDENIDVNYYKFDFEDGSRLIVAEYPHRKCHWNDEWKDEYFYHLLEKGKSSYTGTYDESFRNQTDSETYLLDFIKKVQKKGLNG